MKEFLLLCWEFFKTGLFAIGGGYATIPFLREMSVKYGWFTLDQLTTMLAVSESTPGPIGVNMATYVGYSQFGICDRRYPFPGCPQHHRDLYHRKRAGALQETPGRPGYLLRASSGGLRIHSLRSHQYLPGIPVPHGCAWRRGLRFLLQMEVHSPVCGPSCRIQTAEENTASDFPDRRGSMRGNDLLILI